MYLAYISAFFFHCALLAWILGPGYFSGVPPANMRHIYLDLSFWICVDLRGKPQANSKVLFPVLPLPPCCATSGGITLDSDVKLTWFL